MLETYIAGDVWISLNVFRINEILVDPQEIVFAYTRSGTTYQFKFGDTGSPKVVKNGVGEYQIAIDTTGWATQNGGPVMVQYVWASRGQNGQGIDEGVIRVTPPLIVPEFS